LNELFASMFSPLVDCLFPGCVEAS
jgi:hypothetical protein